LGLLDYYKQFEDIDPEEARQRLRERRAREKEVALQEVPDVDLSGTEWPEFPNSEVVNASIYTARGRVNGYPDRDAQRIRRVLAERHELDPEQIVLGNGAAELLQAAAYALLGPGDELLTPWPSYPLYPLMAARAGATPVAVDPAAQDLREAMTERTRVLVLCNPNDPTGAYLAAEQVAALASSLPEDAHLLVDEALVHFQDAEPVDSVLRLVDAFPRLLVVRTFSKIYGLSGLRAGYAVGSSASTALLDRIAPVLGVNALTQAAVDQALKIGAAEVQRRREAVIRERAHLVGELRKLPVDVSDSQANFLWLSAREMSGNELANRLRERGVIVAPGGPMGEDQHVRATVRDEAATDRLLKALSEVLS
jgi:histidinol-phosphate aminotransferase